MQQLQLGNWCPHVRVLHIWDRSACDKFVGVSRRGQSTKGADVLRALGANLLRGLTLEASHHGGCGRGRVGDVNGVGAGASDSHNHLQSFRQSNASRAH